MFFLDKSFLLTYYQLKLIILIILDYQRYPKRRQEMSKKSEKMTVCSPVTKDMSFCKVESIISVDERGQMVLPKELREKANIRAGDKLAIVSWDKGGEICCIYLIKAESLADRVKDFLGPMMREMIAS